MCLSTSSPRATLANDQELVIFIGKQTMRTRRGESRVLCLSHQPCTLGTHMLQLEFPPGPLLLRFLCQEVDGDVTMGDRDGVAWPVVLTQHLG